MPLSLLSIYGQFASRIGCWVVLQTGTIVTRHLSTLADPLVAAEAVTAQLLLQRDLVTPEARVTGWARVIFSPMYVSSTFTPPFCRLEAYMSPFGRHLVC